MCHSENIRYEYATVIIVVFRMDVCLDMLFLRAHAIPVLWLNTKDGLHADTLSANRRTFCQHVKKDKAITESSGEALTRFRLNR